MILKYYGLYDGVAKNLVNVFTAQNDEVCVRSCESILKDPKTDVRLLKDCIVQYLYSLDSETGEIVDVTKKDLVAMASLIENYGVQPDDASLAEIKQSFEVIKKEFVSFKNLDSKCQNVIDLFAKQLETLNNTVNDIIGGKIKCQKFKKKK